MDKTMKDAAEGTMSAASFRELLDRNDGPVGKDALSTGERLKLLFDEGTFTELGAYVMKRAGGSGQDLPDELESVRCGYGSVNGCLVYAFAQDPSRMRGSVSEEAGRKVADLYRLAMENGAPVVGIFDSAGAYLPEGVRAMAGYGAMMRAASGASGVIPQIAVVPGIAQGAAAVLVSIFDFVITAANAEISVNPPFVVGGGRTEESVEAGIASLTAGSDREALAMARELLEFIPSNNEDGTAELTVTDEMNRSTDLSAYEADGSAVTLVKAVADGGRYLEVAPSYAPCITTGFITLGGVVCGVVGTDHTAGEGRLTSKGARKAARFLNFCDSFFIPVLTTVDSEGYVVEGDEEKNPFCSEIGKLAAAYASARTPLITLVSGCAYGSVFTVMGSKSVGADLVLALDTARIGCLSPASSVALLWNDRITQDVSRDDLEKEWTDRYANVLEAAKAGAVDDVVEKSELRQRLISAVLMLAGKSPALPRRRHANLPL